MKVRDLSYQDEIYDMPALPAVLRCLKGEVRLEDESIPIAKSIQGVVDELRSQIRPVPREVIQEIAKHQNPRSWSRVLDPLYRLVVKLFEEGRNHVTMAEIREAAAKDRFLENYINSVGQRTRDLVAQKRLLPYFDPRTQKRVPGIYVLPQEKMVKAV